MVIISAEIGVGIFAITNDNREKIDGFVIENFKKIIHNYENSSDTKAVDWVQEHVRLSDSKQFA